MKQLLVLLVGVLTLVVATPRFKQCASGKFNHFLQSIDSEEILSYNTETVARSFCQNGVIKNLAQFSRKPLCGSVFFNKVVGFRKTKVFSCELCKIFNNNIFNRTSLVAATENSNFKIWSGLIEGLKQSVRYVQS